MNEPRPDAQEDLLGRPSPRCVHFVETLDLQVAQGLAARGLTLTQVAVGSVRSGPQLAQVVGAALGRRCTDLAGLQARMENPGFAVGWGRVLVLEDAAPLWAAAPQLGGWLVEQAQALAQQWSAQRAAFHVVFVL